MTTIKSVVKSAEWWRGYDNGCYEAASDQGLAPIALRLAAARIPFTVEQTGGFCMTIGVYLTNKHYIWVANTDEGIGPDATIDDLRWAAYRYNDDDWENPTELTESGTTEDTAAIIAREMKGWGVDATPDVEGSQDLFRDAYTEGLAPMTLRLGLSGIPVTVDRSHTYAPILRVPLTATTSMEVAADGIDDAQDLRWRINRGNALTTADAVTIIRYERSKVKVGG